MRSTAHPFSKHCNRGQYKNKRKSELGRHPKTDQHLYRILPLSSCFLFIKSLEALVQLQYSDVGQWPCITIMSTNDSIMSNLEILALNNYENASPLPELENGTKPTAFPISFPTSFYYTQTTQNPISQVHPYSSLLSCPPEMHSFLPPILFPTCFPLQYSLSLPFFLLPQPSIPEQSLNL